MRRLLVPSILALVLAAVGAGLAVADDGKKNKDSFEYSVGLWGDLPYSNEQATTGFRI